MGFRAYQFLRARQGDVIPAERRWTLIAAAAVGALIGSKLLAWANHPGEWWAHRTDPAWWIGGKTIVGGLLGGIAAVELIKRRIGERRATGDLLVVPLCLGMAIGRVGCFLSGLQDRTHGHPTTLPWGVDFGDGIPRHPVQLYEIVVLAALAAWSVVMTPYLGDGSEGGALRRGDAFRGFMVGYLAFRLVLEAIKPAPHSYAGLSAIQVACLLGLIYYSRDLRRLLTVTWSVCLGRSRSTVSLL